MTDGTYVPGVARNVMETPGLGGGVKGGTALPMITVSKPVIAAGAAPVVTSPIVVPAVGVSGQVLLSALEAVADQRRGGRAGNPLPYVLAVCRRTRRGRCAGNGAFPR